MIAILLFFGTNVDTDGNHFLHKGASLCDVNFVNCWRFYKGHWGNGPISHG